MSAQDKAGELHALKFALSNYLMSIYMNQQEQYGETEAKKVVVSVLKEQLTKFDSSAGDVASLKTLLNTYEAQYRQTKSDNVLQDYLAIERTIDILKENGAN